MWSNSLRNIGSGLSVFWLLLALSSPALAQSASSSAPESPPADGLPILSKADLTADMLTLLREISPELKPTLTAVLQDSEARQRMASDALTKAQADSEMQKELWTMAQGQLQTLSDKIAKERAVEDLERWKWALIAASSALAVSGTVNALERQPVTGTITTGVGLALFAITVSLN